MSSLEENIELYCRAKGITKKELAKRAGITNKTISNILRGKVTSRKNTLLRISRVFDITLGELIGDGAQVKNEISKLGQNIQTFCTKKNMTLTELSERTGISEQTINYIIWDKTKPFLKTVRKIAKTLGVTTQELFGEEKQEGLYNGASSVGEKVRRFCRSQNITLLEFAEMAGISKSTLMNIGKQKGKVRRSTSELIANAMEITVEELLNI